MNQFRLLSRGVAPATRRKIQRVVRSAVPQVADFALAYVLDTVAAVCVATAHVTREGDRVVRALARVHRIKRSDRISSVAEVIRTGRPLLRSSIPLDRRTPDGRSSLQNIADLHRLLAPRSALVVPIADGASVIGAVSLCYSESGRRYTQRDIPAASQVAGEIGRLLSESVPRDGSIRLRPAARDARQGTTVRRRVAPRN